MNKAAKSKQIKQVVNSRYIDTYPYKASTLCLNVWQPRYTYYQVHSLQGVLYSFSSHFFLSKRRNAFASYQHLILFELSKKIVNTKILIWAATMVPLKQHIPVAIERYIHWNCAFWLVKTSHVTFNSQSECLIAACPSYATLKLVLGVGSWFNLMEFSSLSISVTKWLDYWFNFEPYSIMWICPK